jgi:hypothetical protein
MPALTLYRLAEQAFNLIEGGSPGLASSISINELKISCAQVVNKLLKVDYLTINGQMGEAIPNGTVLGLYEDVDVVSWNGKSKATLPIKPLKLPRNMGVWAIYAKTNEQGSYDLDNEFIPLQMGQGALLKSQPLLNNLLGQTGYEVFGNDVIFTKDLKSLFPDIKIAFRLAIMDVSAYGDYDIIPLPPEFEWDVIKEVYQLYTTQPIPDKLVDSTVKENMRIPNIQQKQSP